MKSYGNCNFATCFFSKPLKEVTNQFPSAHLYKLIRFCDDITALSRRLVWRKYISVFGRYYQSATTIKLLTFIFLHFRVQCD